MHVRSQVIGFVDYDLTPAQKLPLQVAGPACLAATCVIVVLGAIFSRLWREEMRRQRREMATKARTQLQSIASDLIVKRGGSSRRRQTLTAAAALQDPQLRRQLLLKLRQNELNGSVHVIPCSHIQQNSDSRLWFVCLFVCLRYLMFAGVKHVKIKPSRATTCH